MLSNKIRVVIIDDEQEGRDIMESLLSNIEDVEIAAIANDADSGFTTVIKHKPDLVFLDIRMPRRSGIELARELSEHRVKPTIVFVTAYDEYAIQAFKVAAFDFLLKPVDPEELRKTIKRYEAEKMQVDFDRKISMLIEQFTSAKKIRLNSRTGFILLDPVEIVYIQADGNYSEIVISQHRKEVVTQNLGFLQDLLPKDKFLRISRSCLINIDYLRKVDRKCRKCELEKNSEIFTAQVSRDMIGGLDHNIK